MVQTLADAMRDARRRVKERANVGSGLITPLDVRVKKYDATKGTRHWQIISKFLFKDAHGRELFKWKAFRDDIHADDTSSEEAKAHADLLWSTANADDVPMDESGEWHHLWPLGVFGSVEDIRNYRRVSIIDHIKLHAALIFFFPWLIELHLALGILLSRAETGQGKKKTGKVSNEILEECLSGTGMAEIAANAAQVQYSNLKQINQGNNYAMKPPSDDKRVMQNRAADRRIWENKKRKQEGRSPLKRLKSGPKQLPLRGDPKKDKKTEQTRLNSRRKTLNKQRFKQGLPLLTGSYTKEEIQAFDPPLKYYT